MSLYVPPPHQVPHDDEDPHYIKSFPKDQVAEYIKFFNEFGFVIVRDVLTGKECEDTIDDIWRYIENNEWTKRTINVTDATRISRKDPSTWGNQNWPTMKEEGIVGVPPAFTVQALKNRQNPEVYQVFANLYGKPNLLVNHDRYGLFRPTKNVVNSNGATVDNTNRWKTHKNCHLDMNPWGYTEETDSTWSENVLAELNYSRDSDFITENNEVGVMVENKLHLQGLINLADNFEEDGGFHIIPGFKHHLAEWTMRNYHLKKRYGNRNTFVVLPDGDKLISQAVRVTARAGSLVVWDQQTIHGSAPNDSNRARYAQFLKYFPATPMNPVRSEARRTAVAVKVKETRFDSNITELGKKLFGLEKW